MIKINPILQIKKNPKIVRTINNSNIFKNHPVSYSTGVIAATSAGCLISTFFQDYNKTVNENYFQFKINPKTRKPFKPDKFQNAAAMNLYCGKDVLVTAPTGTGKTAIAEYIITKNLKEGKRTFYTTPLKALSNEKFLDFSKIYGEENVGLITGDTKINTEAPIIIMTTEVYRNMSATEKFNFDKNDNIGIPANLKTVIFDELQYLGDVDRGGIWEQAIMFTPQDVQILSLSATIGNNIEINDWIARTKNRKGAVAELKDNYKPNNNKTKETVLIDVPSENRHVPLIFEIESAASEITIPRNLTKKQKAKAKSDAARKTQSIYAKPRDDAFKKLTQKLYNEDKLPAIYFVFSKKECRHLLKYLSTESELLTNEKEQKEIEKVLKQYERDGIYLGESLNIEALRKGYAIHNAGLLPSQKRLIEELFQKKLVKVVLATETLSAGINMPARTTVISSLRKPTSTPDGGEDKKRNLTPNEYHQMAGRAGRRGIDTVGYCYSIGCNPVQKNLYQELMASTSNKLESNLNLDYSFITNYLAEFSDKKELEYVLSKSLFVYDDKTIIDTEKLNQLLKTFDVKKGILTSENFIDKQGKLTIKGQLIKHLNGYEQIPVINIISDKSLANLSEKQIVAIVGALANIEYDTRNEIPKKEYELKYQDNQEYTLAVENLVKEVKKYDAKISTLNPTQEIRINNRVIDHLYKWIDLNLASDDKKKNWKELYGGELKTTIKDEGSIFKEIMSTKDLLKQLINVAEAGIVYSDSNLDKNYYLRLKEKLETSVRLIDTGKSISLG